MIDGALPGDAMQRIAADRQAAKQAALNPQPGDRVLAVVPGGLRWGWCMAVDGDGWVALNLGLGRHVWVRREDVREVEEG